MRKIFVLPRTYDRKKLFAAFDKAGISEKINSLPLKEKTYMIKDVYKDAADFSGGEKQKLLLAKAIYKNAPVLILGRAHGGTRPHCGKRAVLEIQRD